MITGTLVNVVAVVAGGVIGLGVSRLGRKNTTHVSSAQNTHGQLSERVMKAFGLVVMAIGVRMIMEEHDVLSVVFCIALGTLIGELLDVEGAIERFGEWLKERTGSSNATFVSAFLTSTVLFCVGAMAFVGSLNDGLKDEPDVLFVKSMMDFVSSILLSATMGIGVLFSAVSVLVIQGAISLGASQLVFLMNNPLYINGLTVVGGVMILGIGANVSGMAKIRVGNILPALLLIILVDAIMIAYKGT
ncbi:DUF554 domain-containing protein [Deferribacterales bacterium RsTz2092]|nr:membrane protein [Deferribacterales bacterium]